MNTIIPINEHRHIHVTGWSYEAFMEYATYEARFLSSGTMTREPSLEGGGTDRPDVLLKGEHTGSGYANTPVNTTVYIALWEADGEVPPAPEPEPMPHVRAEQTDDDR